MHIFGISLSDPCEYNNLAHSNLEIVQYLLQKLIGYQKNALPVWFPERDPTADPASHTGDAKGYWGPWMSSTANKAILKNVLDNIPTFSEKKHHQASHRATSDTKFGKVFSTHAEHDQEVYNMLKEILQMTNQGKKGLIPFKTNSEVMKESLAMLYAKMKRKTEIDDLMHKLQMIKKGRVAKRKGHGSWKASSKSKAQSLSHSDSKLLHNDGHKVDKNGAKRTGIESVASDENIISEDAVEDSLDKNSVSGDEEQQTEDALSALDVSSDTENFEQNDFKPGGLMNENDSQIEGESNSEDGSSELSADIPSETSAKGSGIEFQKGSDVTDAAVYDIKQ